MMEPFRSLEAVAAPLPRDNVDTDAIIPSREMRSVSRSGLADGLFAGWRYAPIGSREENPEFVLNQPRYRDARILVSGANFGCGSSREHAAWALREYGIRAVIAPSFNPIFKGNCVANGIVPVELLRGEVAELLRWLEGVQEPLVGINLESGEVVAGGRICSFGLPAEAREMLLNGLDPVELTLGDRSEIENFRAQDHQQRNWVYESVNRD